MTNSQLTPGEELELMELVRAADARELTEAEILRVTNLATRTDLVAPEMKALFLWMKSETADAQRELMELTPANPLN